MSEHDGDNLPNSVQNNNNDSLRAKFQKYLYACKANFHGTNLIIAEEGQNFT